MLRPLSKSRLLCFVLADLLCFSLVSPKFAVAQSTGIVSGRVRSLQTGIGISGATVSALGPSFRETTTDYQGYYTLYDLAPGPYTIAASATSYVDKTYSSFIGAAETTLPDFQLNKRSIIGKVYDASTPTLPIAEANITLSENFVLTNASGYYEWLDLSAGTYTLTASAPGYISQPQEVAISEGTTTADFGLDPVGPGRIAGTVTDSTTRDGLPGATVRVRRGSYEKTGNTNSNGQYSIENVPAWSYWTVDAYRFGYIAQTGLTASVQSGETTTLHFELVPYGNISGTVKDQNTNQPIEGALVRADSVFLDTTDSSGYYTMFAEAGTYTVTASAPGYSPSSQLNVKVPAGETKTVSFLLQSAPPGKIVGRVTDAITTLGIASALVTTDGYSNFTNTNGDYVLSNVPAWYYTISVSAPGFVSSSTQRTVPSGGLVTADLALNPDTRVSLEPYLNFGNPEESFSVDLYLSDSRFVYSWEVYLWWNPALLEATSLVEGSFLKGPFGDRTTDFSFDEYVNEGVIHAKCQSTLSVPDSGVSGSGTLATLTFQIKATGSWGINVTSALLFSPPPSMPTFIGKMENAIFRTLQGDVNNDMIINSTDLVFLKEAYGSKPGDAHWNVDVDVNRDQTVSALDLHKVGKDYGKSA